MIVGNKPLRFKFHSYVGGASEVITEPAYVLFVKDEVYYVEDMMGHCIYSAPIKIVKYVQRVD